MTDKSPVIPEHTYKIIVEHDIEPPYHRYWFRCFKDVNDYVDILIEIDPRYDNFQVFDNFVAEWKAKSRYFLDTLQGMEYNYP